MSTKSLIFCICLLSGSISQGQNILENFFNGKPSYTVKFDYRQQFIVVSAKFQGFIDLNFIVDTGSEYTVLFDKSLTDLFDYTYSKKVKIIGSDYTQSISAYVARNVRLKMDGIPERHEDLIVLEHSFESLSYLVGIKIDGIIGGSFFRNAILEIDYRKWNIVIHNASKFEKNMNGYHTENISFLKGKPYVFSPCILSDNTLDTLALLIDTGASLAVLLYANKITGITVPEKFIPGQIGFGLGGELNGFLGRIKKLDFATFKFNNLISHFQVFDDTDSTTTNPYKDGIIGNEILERFNVVIDYVHSKIHVKESKKWNESFKQDRSGIIVVAAGEHFSSLVVQAVIASSPAAEAGIKAGDVIKKVGFWPAIFYGLGGISKKFRGVEGKKIRIKVLRDGKKLKYTFRLRDLI